MGKVFYWPIHGTYNITSPFGQRSSGMHYGIDMAGGAAVAGSPIYSCGPGVVSFVRSGQSSSAGYYCTIRHDNGFYSSYMHMQSAPSVTVGQRVGVGTVLGKVGSTGHSTGPHLHWQIGSSYSSGSSSNNMNPVTFMATYGAASLSEAIAGGGDSGVDTSGSESTTTKVVGSIPQDKFDKYVAKYSDYLYSVEGVMEHLQKAIQRIITITSDSAVSSDGTVSLSGNFIKYTLTDEQLTTLAGVCEREQGSIAGAKAEASLMSNLFEKNGKKYGSGGAGLYNYVMNSGWFGRNSFGRKPTIFGLKDAIADVLINGNHTLPVCVDEHDCFSDLSWVKFDGVNKSYSGFSDRNKYIKDKTVIHNRYGATYTFYCFPAPNSDPFGYIDINTNKGKS